MTPASVSRSFSRLLPLRASFICLAIAKTRSRNSASTASESCARSSSSAIFSSLRATARVARSLQMAVALGVKHTQLLHCALDARRDLAGFLVAHRLGELRPGVRERAQVVPTVDHVARRAGDSVERPPQGCRRGFQLLGEVHLLFATERSSPTDLLEIGLQRSPLAPGIQVLGRERSRGALRATGFDLGRRCRTADPPASRKTSHGSAASFNSRLRDRNPGTGSLESDPDLPRLSSTLNASDRDVFRNLHPVGAFQTQWPAALPGFPHVHEGEPSGDASPATFRRDPPIASA